MKDIKVNRLNMNGKERIESVLAYLKMTKHAIGVSIGDKNGMRLTYVTSGRNEISEKLAKDISETYPNIRFEWLLHGTEPMLVDTNHVINRGKSDKDINHQDYLAIIEEQRNIIIELRSQLDLYRKKTTEDYNSVIDITNNRLKKVEEFIDLMKIMLKIDSEITTLEVKQNQKLKFQKLN
ncbi:hypothetical protein JJC03_09385 [Flavobacterium oreochromis]|uniref:hypothetical protein n=1 Tax=Flavobacterium oreochromis TaxID=2906078 RepID=UPI001CE6ED8C|nr:hypothetical protein [Flavobacterium oreochromis]QYS85450.1 hypothetical protein JJC03_09385 [Flavobacterium oreochromis]